MKEWGRLGKEMTMLREVSGGGVGGRRGVGGRGGVRGRIDSMAKLDSRAERAGTNGESRDPPSPPQILPGGRTRRTSHARSQENVPERQPTRSIYTYSNNRHLQPNHLGPDTMDNSRENGYGVEATIPPGSKSNLGVPREGLWLHPRRI